MPSARPEFLRSRRDAAVRLAAFVMVVTPWLAFLVIAVTGVKTYDLWPQVLAYSSRTPLDLLLEAHPHTTRYALVYPCVFAWVHLGIPRTVTYGAVACFSLFGTSLLVTYGAGCCSRARFGGRVLQATLSSAGWVALALKMNGRLALAFLGVSMLVVLHMELLTGIRRSAAWIVSAHIVCLLFASVSSGTFMVALTTVALSGLLFAATRPREEPSRALALVVPQVALIILAAPVTFLFIRKNMNYYGGGLQSLAAMGAHGWGIFLLDQAESSPLMLVVSLALLVLLLGTVGPLLRGLYREKDPRGPPLVSVGAGILIGLYGYSTLLGGFPGLAMLGLGALPDALARVRRRLRPPLTALDVPA